MAASDHLNPRQINYRITRDLGTERNEIKHNIYAHHPEHGVIGMLSVTNQNWGEGRPSIPTADKAWGKGLGVSLIHTRPEFQKQGIGSAMYNIAHRELGYAPIHDTVRTKEGERFAQSVSGREGQRGAIPRADPMPSWGVDRSQPSEIAQRQAANYERGTDIDRTWSMALTPQRIKPKRTKQPEQQQLFDPSPY